MALTMLKIRWAIFLLFSIAVALNANAISVASDYLVNDTLELIEGASKIYSIRLQNPTNNEIGIKLDYDATFMKVIGFKEVYILAPKETGYSVSFNVTAPKKPGLYKVEYTVSESEPGGAGLPIRLKINRNFNLKVIEDPNKVHTNYIGTNYSGLVYLALFLIIVLFLLRKKGKYKAFKNKNRKIIKRK